MTVKTSKYRADYRKLSDGQLVDRAKRKDKPALAELIKRYEKKVYNTAFRITRDYDDASDVLQDTFTQVIKKISTFQGESAFSTWLFRIATNYSLMKKRRDKRSSTFSMDEIILSRKADEIKRELETGWSEGLLDKLEKKELMDALNRASYMLPQKYHVVFVLRDINGLSNKEVSDILHISKAAVKSRIHRARLFIRQELSKYIETPKGQNC